MTVHSVEACVFRRLPGKPTNSNRLFRLKIKLGSRGQMSDADNGLEKKYQNLLQKYKTLRMNHRKLAGIALRLAEALEAFLRNDGKPDVRNILLACMTMYPGLVKDSAGEETSMERSESAPAAATDLVAEDVQEETKESETSEKEYFEGFWSKPKIPRTPLV